MYLQPTAKTGWFHLGVVVIAMFISFYFIREALAQPFADFKLYNEIRVAEIQAAGDL